MAMTWTTLTGSKSQPGSIARWINKSTLTSGADGDADSLLQEALGSIYGKLRHWRTLTPPIAGAMTIGQDYLAVPDDMIEPDFFGLTGLYKATLVQKTPNEVYQAWAYDGSGNRIQQQPVIYAFNGTYIQLDQQPDQAYAYVLTYYAVPAALSEANPTNFLTSQYPRLIRSAVMMAAAEWTKESNQGQYDRTYWEQQFASELMLCQAQSDRARRGSIEGVTFSAPGNQYPPYGEYSP